MLSSMIGTKLFEECVRNNYFSCFSKEIAIDFTCVLSHIASKLSKLLWFNILGMNKNATEPVSMFPQVSFQYDLSELLKHTV